MSSSIPKTMKAVKLVKYKAAYELQTVPVPDVAENDVLLKMGAAGFCHTDYQVWEGVYESPCPMTPSHEPVGTIVAVGAGVKREGRFKVGQRVGTILFQRQCHRCIPCGTVNDIRFCEKAGLCGLKIDGGMAEYMVCDADSIMELPASLSFEQAAPLMCAGATVWGGIITAATPAGEAIGVIGIGGLGSLCVQFAKALGYRVVAIDNRIEGRELAQELTLKADIVVDINDGTAVESIKSWAGNGGLASIICCTDSLPAITWSIQALRIRGTLVNIGLPTIPIAFDAFDVVFKEKIIKGSLVANVAEVKDMLKVVDKFGIRSLITTIPLDDVVKTMPKGYMNPHLKGRLVITM